MFSEHLLCASGQNERSMFTSSRGAPSCSAREGWTITVLIPIAQT